MGCLYRDSHKEPAGLIGFGARFPVHRLLHIGAGFGARFQQQMNDQGRNVTDIDPAAAAFLAIGTERHAVQFLYTPEYKLKHATVPAVTWLQVRLGF